MLTWLFTKTPLLFLTQSFWRDEAFSYFLSKKSIFEIVYLTAKDFNPPFYYFILHYWMKIFGGSEIAMRSLSLIFFWATLYVAFLFLNGIFKYKLNKSFLYLILFIINPLLLNYAFEARMYTMLAFFATLSYYSFLKKDSKLYLLSSILGLYTHYFMIFVIISQIYLTTFKKDGKYGVSVKYPILSFLIFSPWLAYILISKSFASTSFWIGPPQIQYFFSALGKLFTGNETPNYDSPLIFGQILKNLNFISLVLSVPMLSGIYFLLHSAHKKDRHILLTLFVWAFVIPLIIVLISFIKPIYSARYLIFSVVGLILLTIFVLEKFNVYLKWFFLIVLILLTVNYNRLQLPYQTKVDSRATFTDIKAIANKNDLVYVTDELDYFTAEYYFGENRVYIYGKTYQEIPDYVGKVLISQDRIVTRLPIYPKEAFVVTPDNQYTIQAIY